MKNIQNEKIPSSRGFLSFAKEIEDALIAKKSFSIKLKVKIESFH